MEEAAKPSCARVNRLKKNRLSRCLSRSPNQGDDWWSLQRKQQGQIRAKEREPRLQREREERGEDQKLRNRLHWEKMRRAAQDDPWQ